MFIQILLIFINFIILKFIIYNIKIILFNKYIYYNIPFISIASFKFSINPYVIKILQGLISIWYKLIFFKSINTFIVSFKSL